VAGGPRLAAAQLDLLAGDVVPAGVLEHDRARPHGIAQELLVEVLGEALRLLLLVRGELVEVDELFEVDLAEQVLGVVVVARQG